VDDRSSARSRIGTGGQTRVKDATNITRNAELDGKSAKLARERPNWRNIREKERSVLSNDCQFIRRRRRPSPTPGLARAPATDEALDLLERRGERHVFLTWT